MGREQHTLFKGVPLLQLTHRFKTKHVKKYNSDICTTALVAGIFSYEKSAYYLCLHLLTSLSEYKHSMKKSHSFLISKIKGYFSSNRQTLSTSCVKAILKITPFNQLTNLGQYYLSAMKKQKCLHHGNRMLLTVNFLRNKTFLYNLIFGLENQRKMARLWMWLTPTHIFTHIKPLMCLPTQEITSLFDVCTLTPN